MTTENTTTPHGQHTPLAVGAKFKLKGGGPVFKVVKLYTAAEIPCVKGVTENARYETHARVEDVDVMEDTPEAVPPMACEIWAQPTGWPHLFFMYSADFSEPEHTHYIKFECYAELLEALERIERIEDDYSDRGHGSAKLKMREVARAAILKATGGSQ